MSSVVAHTDALKTLELFNEKADQLLASAFFNEVSGGGAIVQFNRESGWDSVYVGPNDESTRALVLTLRMFLRDRDGMSPRAMAKLYGSVPISAQLQDEFDMHRSRLNAFLDSKSPLAISDDGPLTYREILDIFVWGEYAHLDARHRQTYEDLRTTPFFPLFQNCLVDAVIAFARCISAIREVNRRAAAQLASSDS